MEWVSSDCPPPLQTMEQKKSTPRRCRAHTCPWPLTRTLCLCSLFGQGGRSQVNINHDSHNAPHTHTCTLWGPSWYVNGTRACVCVFVSFCFFLISISHPSPVLGGLCIVRVLQRIRFRGFEMEKVIRQRSAVRRHAVNDETAATAAIGRIMLAYGFICCGLFLFFSVRFY